MDYMNTGEGTCSSVENNLNSPPTDRGTGRSQVAIKKKQNEMPLIEISKKKAESHSFHIPISSSSTAISKKKTKKRLDVNGTEISRKNKRKVKITFLDNLPNEQLVDVVTVESYKKYNTIKMPALKDIYVKNSTCCSCNLI